MDNEDYLFQSQKGDNLPIQRMQAWKILNDAAREVGIKDPIGCHTMRKTFSYHMYLSNNKDITLVQKLLNHSSPAVTLRYIGIQQDDLDSALDNFTCFDNIIDNKKINNKKSKIG